MPPAAGRGCRAERIGEFTALGRSRARADARPGGLAGGSAVGRLVACRFCWNAEHLLGRFAPMSSSFWIGRSRTAHPVRPDDSAVPGVPVTACINTVPSARARYLPPWPGMMSRSALSAAAICRHSARCARRPSPSRRRRYQRGGWFVWPSSVAARGVWLHRAPRDLQTSRQGHGGQIGLHVCVSVTVAMRQAPAQTLFVIVTVCRLSSGGPRVVLPPRPAMGRRGVGPLWRLLPGPVGCT